MKLVIIFGPPAVGKMTVGKELAKVTDLKLFHNHMSLELVNRFFDFGTKPFRSLDKQIRFAIFNEVATSNLHGLIFTYVWAIAQEGDLNYVNKIANIFESNGGSVYYVELKADLSERLKRNVQPDRLAEKPSKRNIVFSEKNLLELNEKYQLNTTDEDFADKQILKIDNTHLSADEVATRIKKHFDL